MITKNVTNKILLQYNNGKNEEINHSKVFITGENNIIKIKCNDKNAGLEILEYIKIDITGFNNIIELDNIHLMKHNRLADYGFSIPALQIFIGGAANHLIYPNEIRYCNNSIVKIGDNSTFAGVTMYLQDSNSSVNIGKNCMFSYGIDVWCSDIHTIINFDGKPLNRGKFIEIGNHVWVGKDVKIGKNTKISSNSVIGWASVVTKEFDETNVVIAGNPAKIVKRNINWNARDIENYEKHFNKGDI